MDSITTPQFPSRYQIERLLGEGAYGAVYLAVDTERSCQVVIKALKSTDLSNDTDNTKTKRFHNEFNALKNCLHPNIIRVFDFCEFDNRFFYTMEYLEGKTLDILISESERPIVLESAIEYLFQVAQALLAVHEQGMIHRDLKPANVFITKDNQVKLLDFGIARLEQTNFNLTTEDQTLGTPYYMSPEQNAREVLDQRSDIYSFGILAFELLTKERPYQSNSQFDLYIKHVAAEIPSAKDKNPHIPAWLDALTKTCMQKDRTRRYQSMLEIIGLFLKECPHLPADTLLQEKLKTINSRNLLKDKENARRDHEKNFFASFKRLTVVLAIVVLFNVAWASPLGDWDTANLLRTLFWIRGEVVVPKNVVIVALDDLTYQHFNISTRQPFPRKYWAEALKKIHLTNPKIVIIDGYFQKEDNDDQANNALESAIASGPTVLMKWRVKNRTQTKRNINENNYLTRYNDPRFGAAALTEIKPFVQPSLSGVVMKIGLNGNYNNRQFVIANERIPIRAALSRAGIQNLSEPTYRDFINFYGKPNSILSYSMYEVISKEIDFKDKIVLMGYKSLAQTDVPGAYDIFTTSGSFNEDYFGVEIHATTVGNLIDHSFIKGLPEKVEDLFLTLLPAFIFLFLLTKKPAHAVLYFIAILALWFAATVWAFLSFQVLVPGIITMLVCSFIVCAGIWFFYGNAKAADLTEAEKLTRMKLGSRVE